VLESTPACREVADDSKGASDGTSLADKPEIILERLGFARPRQQQLVCSASCISKALPGSAGKQQCSLLQTDT